MWPWNAATVGEVYLFHFHQPFGNPANRRAQASYYCGFAEDLEARIAKQLAGRGAKIVAAALSRGIGYDLYHWPACLLVEKLIKARKETAVFCPTCARAAGRKPRPLPTPAIQLAFDLEELPDVPVGKMGWVEMQIEQRWRQARVPMSAGLDDDLL
jgi:hypothetical protein